MYEEYLMHHGVKGMKWGVRKTKKAIKKFNKYSRNVYLAKDRIRRAEKLHKKNPDNSVFTVNGRRMTVSDLISEGKKESARQMKVLTEMSKDIFANKTSKYEISGRNFVEDTLNGPVEYPTLELYKKNG